MASAFERLAASARLDRSFDVLCELILQQCRAGMAGIEAVAGAAVVNDRIAAIRTDLATFRGGYLAIMEDAWRQSLSDEELAAIAEAMAQPGVARFFTVSEQIEPLLKPRLDELTQGMVRSIQNRGQG